jgi:hypothetical protein
MNKVCGPAIDFTLVKEEGTRTVISYDLQEEAGKELATWREIYFPKKQVAKPTIEMVKDAILADIDAQTDEKILDGYEFTPDGADTPIIVWLSKESQTNFSEAHRLQIVPVKFKLNETADKQPIYHTFETFEELNRFYVGGVAYINQCLNEGWARKDSIDWAPYEQALNPQSANETKGGKKSKK